MARHKSIPDEHVLDRLFEVIAETGPDGLTFAKSAAACGLSPASLVQRYGNRERLVEAILLRAWDRLDAETAAADAEEAVTPQGAVDFLMRLMPPESAERDATDGLLLLREDIRNPNCAPAALPGVMRLPKRSAVASPKIGRRAGDWAGRWPPCGRAPIPGGLSRARSPRNTPSGGC